MKVLAIIASPRKQGNTFLVVEKITEKLKSLGGVDVEYIFLSDVNLEGCKGCSTCFLKGNTYCPANSDDRIIVEEKILASDAVIFASPVYAMNMTALMKNFMDRFAFTMHRPRFFHQKTMIVALTGAVGLKETINSISQLKYSGFDIAQTLGLVMPNPLDYKPDLDEKIVKKIEKSAQEFYKKVVADKPMKPSWDAIVQFRVQQKIFAKNKDKLKPDFEYFNERGWLDTRKNYYTDNADVNFIKDLFARLVAAFV